MQNTYKNLNFLHQGKVICYLVGAGPGDAGLVTKRAIKLVGKAKIIVFDKLIPENILDLAKKNCKKIYVGKMGNVKSISQIELNRVLIRECLNAAKAAKVGMPAIVVRLKGGDPMLFGRVVEEMEALKKAGIPFEIVPGVSSAFAAPAYAGIPLTARGKSHSVSFVTGRLAKKKELKVIAASDTVIYLMAVSNIAEIVKKNLLAGKKSNTPVALIENGTLGKQRVVLGTLASIEEKFAEQKIRHPGTLVVGAVAHFSNSFPWFANKPLYRKRIGLFRKASEMESWVDALEEDAATVICMPLVSSRKIGAGVTSFVDRLASQWGNCIIFSSRRAVTRTFEALEQKKKDSRCLAGLTVITVGKKTADCLQAYGVRSDIIAKEGGQEGLLASIEDFKNKMLMGHAKKNRTSLKIFYPRAKEIRSFLLEKLEEKGVEVESFVLYENYICKIKEEEKDFFLSLDAMVFASKKSIDAFFYNFSKEFSNASWIKNNKQQFPKLFFFDKVSLQAFLLKEKKNNLVNLFECFKIKSPTVASLKLSLAKLL